MFVLLLGGLIVLVSWQSYGRSQSPAKKDPIKPVMERKLGHAKSLLEALATEDFPSISRNAQSLSLLSLESSWNTIVTEEYLKQSNAFRNSLESIRDGAKSKNIDRATLGYVDMTIRCVECHKYLKQNAGKAVDRALGE